MKTDTQQDLFNKPFEPHFNGPDYVPERDWKRLNTQIANIYDLMRDQNWRSLRTISAATGYPEASISAQLRHLRKTRFGSHTVNKKHLGNGFYHYQLEK